MTTTVPVQTLQQVLAQAAVMPQGALGGMIAPGQTQVPTPAPRPGATMSKSSPDANVGHFYYKTDLTVDQPVDLPDGTFFKARRTKDEDVALDASGQLVIVSTDITTITQTMKKDEHSYEYDSLKKEVKNYAKKCHSLGVKLNGEVVVYDGGESKYFRLIVRDNTVDVEGAVLGWPGGGTAPLYDDW